MLLRASRISGKNNGDELANKIRAAYSSSAVAVDVFAGFKCDPAALALAGLSRFVWLRFEATLPTGLRGGRAPNPDLLAIGPEGVVAV